MTYEGVTEGGTLNDPGWLPDGSREYFNVRCVKTAARCGDVYGVEVKKEIRGLLDLRPAATADTKWRAKILLFIRMLMVAGIDNSNRCFHLIRAGLAVGAWIAGKACYVQRI
jgi:hypothetical protein